MGGDDVLACSLIAFCPLQDTEKTPWSTVALNLESSEGREMKLSSLGSDLLHSHREAGGPQRKAQGPSRKLTFLLF